MSNTTAKLMQLIHDMGVISERMDAKDKRIAELEGSIVKYVHAEWKTKDTDAISLNWFLSAYPPKGGNQ